MRQKSYGYTEALSKYAANLRYDDIPAATVEKTKTVVLDTIGVMMGACQGDPATVMNGLVRETGGRPECTVLGNSFKTDVLSATLANGTMGHDMELDDIHTPSNCHVAAVIIPAVLTAGERFHANGKKLIESINVAYDIEGRICHALDPFTTFERAFHNTSVGGHFGSAAAIGKMLGLDPKRFAWALGHAGSQASGMNHWENEEDHYCKSLQTGVPARSGVLSAMLAERGYPSSPDILEGNYNVFDAFSGLYDFEKLTDRLGVLFEIDRTSLKYYANCRWTHGPLELFTELRTVNHIKPEEIESCVVKLCEFGAPIVNDNDLITHNCQYVLAVSAYGADMHRRQSVAKRVTTPEVVALKNKITVVGDPVLSEVYPVVIPTIVEINTYDGRHVEKRLDYPKGDAHNMLTRDEVEEKFLSCSGDYLNKETARKVMDLVWNLENLSDAGDLMALLADAKN